MGRVVSILYEANEVCNGVHEGARAEVDLVSILYEANEVCNGVHEGARAEVDLVSILYEANEVCNVVDPRAEEEGCEKFQSSTRLTRFATDGRDEVGQAHVCFNPLRG